MANEIWTREQTIVALRTYFCIPFNRATNSNPEIIEKSKIIGRSVNSLKMKIGNFGSMDPELAKRGIVGLSGHSKLDRQIWDEFYGNREKLAFESTRLIADFQNRTVENVIGVEKGEMLEGLDMQRLIKTRVNQRFFRECILGIYDSKCCITGLNHSSLLVASHIVPWAKNERIRLSPENGLCLNVFHDKAFDRGLLTITKDYKIKISTSLSKDLQDLIIKNLLLDYDGKMITMPERYYPNVDYLDYHNNEVFIV